MKQKINQIQNQLNKDLVSLKNLDNLESIRVKYLGRKGQVNKLFQSLSPKEKAVYGKDLNQLKNEIEEKINKTKQKLLNLKPKKKIDVTMPGIKPQQGHLHLLTQGIEEIEEIFKSLGFVRRRYPEVDTDWYYAEGLNIPKDHPGRDDQETFYVNQNIVLTAHTSNGQLREMERVKTPPIKMINIGKTYRRQASNTHSPMFHQFEGLMIDKDINITHLIGVSNYFARHYFGPNSKIRLRPHHFQFTEPSFEVDISCSICNGTGQRLKKTCPVCKAGWLELGGAGMVHPQVLKNGRLNPNKYSGFAFGWGIERAIMMKHKVSNNLRNLYQTDLRFLSQF
ncbi:phenylalanine--tRNA ligase subunit alpha [Patescibacteria group bacterium]|nr:phenylalanine--tRNA ligase subunit alpha [Patescibacteria group bacterium]MBU1256148.1 phenylalanine--tRNA ligase subunit alpha [Patescibacteria group bacterium]MBU1457245.1 phenylalanine--tRNA ligase subunit alpha [Patescibacteria group bacterium]